MTTKTTILSLFTIALLSAPMAAGSDYQGDSPTEQLAEFVERVRAWGSNETNLPTEKLDELVNEVFGAAEGEVCVGTHTVTAASLPAAVVKLTSELPYLATGQAASLYVLPDPRYQSPLELASTQDITFKILILQHATIGSSCHAHEESQANGTPWVRAGGGRPDWTTPGNMWSITIEDWKRWLNQ